MVIREIHDFSLAQIADSGQCFRMNRLDSRAYRVIAFDKYLEILDLGNDRFQFSCSEDDFRDIWTDYFDLSADYKILKTLVPSSDTFLHAAIDYGWGMRILHQNPWEVTVSFIISQRKSIPAIKTAIETICVHFGTQMTSDGTDGTDGTKYFCFPSAKHIAELQCDDIDCCSLGYRDKYVISAAQSIANGEIDFAVLRETDENSAKLSLKNLYGVGEKVADCILLFGLHQTNAFPEDTWIKRIINLEYGGVFPKSLYDGYLGIIQQYMFYYARSEKYKMQHRFTEL